MKKDQKTNNTFDLEKELEIIAEQARGCDEATIAYSILYLICMASGNKFQNGRYTPDPSDIYCWFYDKVNSAMAGVWDRFIEIGRDEKLRETIDRIQSSNITLAEYRRAFKKWADKVNEARSAGMILEPKAVREVARKLLNYKGGRPLYNPFAGSGAYGDDYQIGNYYHAEEFHREIWGVGMMRLLMRGTPSENYLCRMSPGAVIDSQKESGGRLYDYIICTTPFGMRIPDENGIRRPVEDIILSSIRNMLTPSGRMVLVVPSTMLNRGGRTSEVRQDVCEQGWLEAVVTLPRNVFTPHTGIQTAILVIDRNNTSQTVKLVDATSCMGKKVLDADSVLSVIGNKNYTTEVSMDDLQENNYSWHFEKYEYIHAEPGEDGVRIMELRDLLCSTGTKGFPQQRCKKITSSDLSSDPFNFRIDIEKLDTIDIPELRPNNDIETEISEVNHNLSQISLEIEQIAKEKHSLDTHLNEIRSELELLSFSEKEIKEAEDQLLQYDKTIAALRNNVVHKSASNHEAEIKALDQSLITLREATDSLHKRYERQKEDAERFRILNSELALLNEKKFRCVQREKELEDKESRLQLNLADLKKHSLEVEGRRMLKLSRPSLIIGGTKPKAKFAFIQADLNSPVYLASLNCLAFTVDENIVNLDYLAYQISVIDFKDFGAILPIFRSEDILNVHIPVPSIEEQIEFMRQREFEIFPYKKEIEDLKQANIRNEETIMNALGSKQHDMGNLCPRITLRFADLYDMVCNMPNDTAEKGDIIRMIKVISEDIKDMNRMISILSEKGDFPAATSVDLVQFFKHYVANHPTDGYKMSFIMDESVEHLGGHVIVSTAEIALTRVLMNIRENAEMHGFNPDLSGVEHFLDIKLSVDYSEGKCVIDFINNGRPMPNGMTDTIYATRGEYAGETGHTGNGGWYIAGMAKFYGGECHVNPKGTKETTIRITIPWSNE